MKTEFNPLEALADISEDELNEFIELQEEAPIDAGAAPFKSIQSIDGLCILSGGTTHKDTSAYYAIFRQLAEAGGRELTKI